MHLLSAVVVAVSRPQAVHLNADHGLISKQPRQVLLTGVRMTREQKQLQSDLAALFLREDNTVDRIVAEGDVRSEFHGRSLSNSKTSNSETSNPETHARSDRAELFLTGTRNQLATAILSGNVQLASQAPQPAEAAGGGG